MQRIKLRIGLRSMLKHDFMNKNKLYTLKMGFCSGLSPAGGE